MSITFEPIGIIHTPFKTREGMPIQASRSGGTKGRIELRKEFVPGLADLDGFSHIVLIYHFHKSVGFELRTTPFLDNKKHGLFATRSPKRPNPIGLSVVRLLKISGNTLDIENVDMLDGTPLLDIKPYIPGFDQHAEVKTGWISGKLDSSGNIRSDNRFA